MAADRITKLEQQLRADQGDQALRIRLNNLKAGANQVATFQGQTLHEDQLDALRLIAKQYGQPAEKIVKYFASEGLYITQLTLQNPAEKKVNLTIPLALIKLSSMYFYRNKVTSLKIPDNIPLQKLGCSDNQLTNLTIPPNTPLIILICTNNQLTNLTIPPGTPIQELDCRNNPLKTLTLPRIPNLNLYAPPNTQINYH